MIESEEKRQRINENIKQWCDHVKATPLLRNYDIPSLVKTILEEFYHLQLSCGHLVKDYDEGVILEFYEYPDKNGTVIGSYCKDCVEKYKKELGAWEVKNEN